MALFYTALSLQFFLFLLKQLRLSEVIFFLLVHLQPSPFVSYRFILTWNYVDYCCQYYSVC